MAQQLGTYALANMAERKGLLKLGMSTPANVGTCVDARSPCWWRSAILRVQLACVLGKLRDPAIPHLAPEIPHP